MKTNRSRQKSFYKVESAKDKSSKFQRRYVHEALSQGCNDSAKNKIKFSEEFPDGIEEHNHTTTVALDFPSMTKADRSNFVRLNHLENRRQLWEERQNIINMAFEGKSSSLLKNKKIVFTENSSVEDDEQQCEKEISNETSRLQLFDECDDDDDDDDDDTLNYTEFPNSLSCSKAQQRMMRHQAKLGLDPRFRMNAQFLADFEESDYMSSSNTSDNESDVNVQQCSSELSRNICIAEKVISDSSANSKFTLPTSIINKPFALKRNKNMTSGRYNPDNPEHHIYELRSDVSNKKTSTVDNVSNNSVQYAQQVNSSTEAEQNYRTTTAEQQQNEIDEEKPKIFIDQTFLESLKNDETSNDDQQQLTNNKTFSILACFGKLEANNDESEKTSKLEAQLNAVDYLSEKFVNSEGKYEKKKKKAESKPIENGTFGRGDNFFFKRNDPRLLEDLKSFRNASTREQLWQALENRKPLLIKLYKNRWSDTKRRLKKKIRENTFQK
ncbi:Nucleolar protein [Trichinella pseudospiralis]